MIPFTPDERRAEFAPSQNQGGPVDPDVLAVIGQPVSQEPAMSQPTIPEPVDPDVLDIVNRDQIPLMSSLMSASRVNPDQAAEASRLGARIGVGQDVALRNMDEVRQRAFMADMQARDIARTNPVLASFLMDRTFANQASDDVGTLEKLAQTMDYVSELPSEFMAGFRTGRITTEAGLLGTTAQLRGKPTEDEQRQWNAYQQELADLAGDTGFWRQTGELLGQIERTAEESVKGAVIGGGIGAGGALLAGQFGPQIFLPEEIVTVPAATIFGMGAGATSAMISTSGRVMAGNNYMKNLDAGMDPDVARVTALGVGLLGGALEVYGVKLLAAPFKGVWSRMVMDAANEAVTRPTVGKAIANFGTSYAKGVGGEIGTEVSQQVVEIAFDEMGGYISDPEAFQSRLATREGRQSIKNELTDVIVRTALGVSAIGGIGPGINIAIDLRRAKQTTKQTKFFESLTQNATESKVRGRDVGAYERFVAAQAAGTNAETVFVDGATMRGVLEQAAVTDSQLDAVVPGLAQKVRDAATTGSDVTIPTAQYAARLAGTDLGNALLPHMRLAPDAISATEAQAVEASRAEIVAQAEKLMEEKQTVDAAFVQSAQAVEDSIFNAVKAVGYSDVQARTYAKIHQAMAVVDAAAMGITPEEYNRKYPPTIVGEGMPVQAMEQAARIDTNYMAAVERGDMATAQRMVDEAAKASGLTEIVWRGDRNAAQITEYRRGARREPGIFTTTNQYVADKYAGKEGGARRFYVGGRTLDLTNQTPEVIAWIRKWSEDGNWDFVDRASGESVTPEDAVMSGRLYDWEGTGSGRRWKDIQATAAEDGYDIVKLIDEDPDAVDGTFISTVVLNENKIKLADAVTRDEAGNIVPLSRRFNVGSPKIFEQAAISSMDADYMTAVERGDTATAQRMVDDAAYQAGYTIEAEHQTNQWFSEFKAGELGFHIGAGIPEGMLGQRTMKLRARIANPLRLKDLGVWSADRVIYSLPEAIITERQRSELLDEIPEEMRAGSPESGDMFAYYDALAPIRDFLVSKGYDGIVYKNEAEGREDSYIAFDSEQLKSADPVTRDEQGNVVPLSRRFDITSPKVFEQAATGPRLMAVHNLSADNLQFAERMGGLAVPSIGVITEEAGGVEGFGEITLLGTREMAEPRTTPVFEADAYSARFPRPEWPKVSTAKADAVVASIRDLQTEFDDVGLVDSTFNFLVNEPDANKLAERWLRSPAIMAMYLRERGIEIAPILETRPTLSRLTWEAIDRLTPIYLAVDQQQAYDVMEASPEYAALKIAYADEVRRQYQGVAEELPEGRVEEWAKQFTPTTLQRLSRDVQETNRQRVAREATANALTEKLEPSYAEYKTWVDKKTRGQFGAPFLRDGKLKRPYTLGNIVDFMASAKVKGEEKGLTFGAGAARAKRARAFPDLEEMREAAKTAIVNPDEYSKARKESEKTLEAYRLAVVDYTRLTDWRGKQDTWAAMDASMKALARYGKRKKRSAKAMREALSREQFAIGSMPAETIEQAIDAADALFNAPVPYFEAKPQRAVRLDEFAGAVIPTDASQQTRDILERSGIPYMSYIAGNEQDRQRAVRQMSVSPEARGEVLFQAMPSPGPARGGHDPRTLTTVINKGADVTTLFHELIHYKVEVYLRIASAPDAPARIKADLDELFKFMGVAGATFEERLATYNGLTFEQRRPLEEKITYNFEDYLLEGKAPSVEMRGVFDRIAAWMRRVYKSLRDDLNAIYRREFGTDLPILTPEIRSVFDRMLASEEQIKRAEAVNNMKGLFQTQEQSGMDDTEWAAYQAMQKEATDVAIAALTTDTMKQVEWMSNARSKKLKELQKAHDTQRKEVRDQVMAEVRQEPIYRAMEYLKRGTLIGPDGSETTVEGVHKINTALAREFVPGLDMAKMGRGKYGYLAEDGLHPDVVAEMFGFPAGSALLQALADAKPMREVVDARTDEIMVRDYSEMGDPKAQEAAVNRAIHNEARARLVAVEARWLSKATQPVRVIQEAARQAAVDAVGNTVIRDLRPDQYAAAEARASRDAIEAARGADTKRLRERYGADATREQIMLQAKRQQLYQNALATEAQKADDAIQKGLKYLRRVLRDSNRQRMGADYADQITGILDRFELAPISRTEAARRADLAAWVEAKRAEGLEPDIDPEVLAESNRRPWRNLTVTEFNAVMDAVKQIEFMGKNERKIKLAAEKADFEKVRDEIVTSVIANAGDRKANARTATTNIGRAITTLKGFIGAHLKAASIARILDGAQDGGPVWNYLIRSANDAGDKETTMRAQATERLTAMFAPIFKLGKMGGKGQYFPTVDRSFNREARLVIALNMGNDGNIQRLLNGESWSIEQITPILQSLTEDEWNLVQQVWDYFETYRPEIAAKERELYGKEPNWVEPKPLIVQTADGKTVTLRGGYYPIKYDPRASMRSETMSDAEVAKRDLAGAFTSATTRRSYTKARVEELKDKRPLLYTLAGMYGGVNEVIHDLSWHRWLIQANRLMRSQAFDEAVREKYGPEFIGQLKTWIKDVAAGERGVQNEAEMALNFLRQGISSAGLGFNVVSAALQITGFNQSIVRVGVKWIGRGIAAVAQSPLLSMKMVNEKSDFMANRSRTQFRELNELRNMVQGDSVAMRRIKMGTYFLMMRMQRMVDVPTWIGAYEKALYEGRDEDTSIALADQAVIDSQGGGMLKDLSRVERGGAGLKLFTVFYGYMNTVYNMAAVQTMTAKNKGKLAADYAMLFVVPVVLGQLIRKAMVPKTEDEPEDLEAIARKLAAEQLSYLMGTMVIVREFGEISKIVAGAEGPRMGYGGPAGLRAVGETYNFATQASQGEFDKAFRKSAVNLIGAFTGLPSAQINRTLDGLDALYEGETENVLAPATGVRR
jgi:hypothetical protein